MLPRETHTRVISTITEGTSGQKLQKVNPSRGVERQLCVTNPFLPTEMPGEVRHHENAYSSIGALGGVCADVRPPPELRPILRDPIRNPAINQGRSKNDPSCPSSPPHCSTLPDHWLSRGSSEKRNSEVLYTHLWYETRYPLSTKNVRVPHFIREEKRQHRRCGIPIREKPTSF